MTTQHLTILTGASRGMGLAMARQLLDSGHRLLCLSRNANEALAHPHCEQWTVDLAEPAAAAHSASPSISRLWRTRVFQLMVYSSGAKQRGPGRPAARPPCCA